MTFRIEIVYRTMAVLAGLVAIIFICTGTCCDGSCETQDRTLHVQIDPTIPVSRPALPATASLPARPIAALTDEVSGVVAEFVANEVILVTSDDTVLNDFLARRGGEIIASIKPSEVGLSADNMHLIRIDPSMVDTSNVETDLTGMNNGPSAMVRVSSAAGLAVLATAAADTIAGRTVGINFLLPGNTYTDHLLQEAPTNDGLNMGSRPSTPTCSPCVSGGDPKAGIEAYTPDPFQWSYYRGAGSVQNVGVGEAWRALQLTGRIDNRVTIAVIDGGFKADADLPIDTAFFSNSIWTDEDPFADNQNSCSGGSPCPYHGANVLSMLAGIPGNNVGVAGVAGPVANVLAIRRTDDIFSNMTSFVYAYSLNVDVISASFGGEIPWTVYIFMFPLEHLMKAIHAVGDKVFVASAGNDNHNLSRKSCLGVCIDTVKNFPCEMSGVVCVGALAMDSQNRASYSNYGENVDIFAPGTEWVGPDPAKPAVHWFNGTSAACPFTAGVVALIRAADPHLSNSDIEDILDATATPSPDSSVGKYVNAYEAVKMALGSAPPEIRITKPANLATFVAGTIIEFTAEASDPEDGIPTVVWATRSFTFSGEFGRGLTVSTAGLAPGTHTIFATAIDSAGVKSGDTIQITIVGSAGKFEILDPVNPIFGGFFFGNVYVPAGKSVVLHGRGTREDNGSLVPVADDELVWFSDVDGVLGRGATVVTQFSTVGPRTVSLGVPLNASDSELHNPVIIDVQPGSLMLPPTAYIISPENFSPTLVPKDGIIRIGANTYNYLDIVCQGTAYDASGRELGDDAVTLTWKAESDLDGLHAEGAGRSFPLRLYEHYFGFLYGGTSWTITLTGTDRFGRQDTHTRTLTVYLPDGG